MKIFIFVLGNKSLVFEQYSIFLSLPSYCLMASVPVLLLLLVFLLPLHASPQSNQSNSNMILLGSSLSPNENHTSWHSPSGFFAFGFYPQENGFAIGKWLVNQTEKTIIWTANRDDRPVSSNAKLDLTIVGKLLLRTGKGREKSIANVSEPATSAAMLDSGNFVLYGNDSHTIWESFDFPTETILGGQSLFVGDELLSSVYIRPLEWTLFTFYADAWKPRCVPCK